MKILGPIYAFLGLDVHSVAIGRCPVGGEWVPCGGLRGNDDDGE